jgi:murein DD-endopeptidase MepM/ murein hydrolase activator NlpD
MSNKPPGDFPQPAEGADGGEKTSKLQNPSLIERLMDALARFGLGELATRIGTHAVSVLLIIAVVWLMQSFYQPAALARSSQETAASGPTPTPVLDAASIPIDMQGSPDSILRLASLRTIIPSRPRIEVIKYTVEPGDSVFGIADKFGLKPSTILFGNYATLADTPHSLRPGQELNILPVDGTYYEWTGVENLNKVAEFFSVDAETIVDYPGNHLDPDAITDYDHPNITTGTWLIVPGGKRELLSWQAPIGITRKNPASARIIGPGSCGPVSGGLVGFGTFVWPTTEHWLSGYHYDPSVGHYGIDLAGSLGNGIFATDAGVIVYAGWNNWGYGNVIVVDHGNDWQSLYAHLSQINVGCGQSVGQGELIGLMGSTGNSSGPHLHFELMNTQYGKVNPLDYMPSP